MEKYNNKKYYLPSLKKKSLVLSENCRNNKYYRQFLKKSLTPGLFLENTVILAEGQIG